MDFRRKHFFKAMVAGAGFLLFSLGSARIAKAQLLQGTIDGNVTDSTQAPIVGAAVTAQSQETNFTREAVTNSAGGYTLASLSPGVYTLTIKMTGFQAYTQTGVIVKGNEVARVDVQLTPGQLNQSVTISAQASTLQTDRADVHTDISTQTLNDLPTPLGRNYQMTLAVIVPGVSTPTSSGSFAANPSRAVQIGVNGTSGWGNDTRIDGTSSYNYNGTFPLYTPALESIQTVNVVTNSFDAEQGLAGGAVIDVQTKSGSNAIHGSAFEFHSNQHLQAYAWAADRTQPKPKYINNQFGGTVGGPILKDKLFYFVSYQGTYVPQDTSLYSEVPTAAMRAGNLSASPTLIYDPATGNANGTGRTPFPGNVIPTSRIDTGIAALLALNEWPNPNVAGTGAYGLARNYLSTGDNAEHQNQFDNKLSWNPNNRLSVVTRFGMNVNSWFNPQQYGLLGGPGYSPSNSAVGAGSGHVYSGTVAATYSFSSNLIADAYFGYSRNDAQTAQQLLDQNLGYTLLQIPGLQSSDRRQGGLPALEIDGFGGAGVNLPESTIGPYNNFQPQNIANVEKEYVGNVTWIKGKHNIRAGVDFDQQQDNEMQMLATFCSYCAGSGGFQFSQGTTQLNGGPAGNDYNAFAAFLLGLPSNVGKVTLFPPEYHDYSNIFGAYVRDQWQVNPKLTVTYGTRWEYYPFANRGSRGLEYLNPLTNQMVICGVSGVPENCGITKDTKRFAPRAGVAYRVTDSTVIRAGYGLTNDPTNIGGALGNRQNYPDILATTVTAPNSYSYATTLRLGLPVPVAPNTTAGVIPVPTNTGVFTVDNKNYVRGYVQSWNFTVEQRIKGWIASAGYVGTRSIDPISSLNQNWSPVGTGTAGQVLNVLAGRTAITDTIGTMGSSKYDALQAKAEHQFARSFQFSATYTFAKALGYSSQIAIPYDYHLNYGNLGGIATQTLGMTLIADSPFGAGKQWVQSGLEGKVLGGWKLEAVSTLRSGTPFTVTASNTTLNAVGSTQFGNCLATPHQQANIYQWYNPSAFAAPSAGQIGNCGTNNLWGPGLVNLDLGLARSFSIVERFKLEARAEAFNAPNMPHHSNPNGNVSSGTFMQALGIANTGREGIDQRTIQFSLRLQF